MPAIQTTYGANIAQAVEGMVANMETANIVSRIIETAAGIGFGKLAARGTLDNQIKVSAAAAIPLGITVLDTTQVGDLYPQYSNVGVMLKGVIWVLAGEAVADGDPVYFVPATGVFVKTVGANILIPNAQWDTTTAQDALGKIRLN